MVDYGKEKIDFFYFQPSILHYYSLSSIIYSPKTMRYKKYLSKSWLTIGGTTFEPPAGLKNVTPQKAGFLGENIFQLAISLMLLTSVLLCLAYLILGGISWITSGGDPKAIDAAKQKIYYAIIGLVMVFLSFFIINLIGYFFGVNLIAPANTTNIITPGGPP